MMHRLFLTFVGLSLQAGMLAGCGAEPPTSLATTSGSGQGGGADQAATTGGLGGEGGQGGSAVATRVPIFIAHGDVGRTTISCDDGRTWVASRSDDDTVVCGNGVDCDHDPSAGHGIAFDGDVFLAAFGWGAEGGSVRRSRDGVTWETVIEGPTFGAIVHGGTMFLGTSRRPQWTEDQGATWQQFATAVVPGMAVIRRAGFAPMQGGKFIMPYIIAPEAFVVVGNATATEFHHAPTVPATCASDIRLRGGVASSNEVILILSGDGTACRSTDAGETWTDVNVGGSVMSHVLWDGAAFRAWGSLTDANGVSVPVQYRSVDGATWTKEPTKLRLPDGTMSAGPSLGGVAQGPQGTFAAASRDRYASQKFYRSTDGLTWDALPADAFKASHRILYISTGMAEPSAECPLQ